MFQQEERGYLPSTSSPWENWIMKKQKQNKTPKTKTTIKKPKHKLIAHTGNFNWNVHFSHYDAFTVRRNCIKEGLECLACPGISKTLISEDSSISPREESRGGAGGGSGSRSKSNLVTVESLTEDKAIYQNGNQSLYF